MNEDDMYQEIQKDYKSLMDKAKKLMDKATFQECKKWVRMHFDNEDISE